MTEYIDFRKLKYERDFFTWYNGKATQLERELADFVFQYSSDYFSDFRFEPNSIVTDFVEAKTSDDGGDSYYDPESVKLKSAKAAEPRRSQRFEPLKKPLFSAPNG